MMSKPEFDVKILSFQREDKRFLRPVLGEGQGRAGQGGEEGPLTDVLRSTPLTACPDSGVRVTQEPFLCPTCSPNTASGLLSNS